MHALRTTNKQIALRIESQAKFRWSRSEYTQRSTVRRVADDLSCIARVKIALMVKRQGAPCNVPARRIIRLPERSQRSTVAVESHDRVVADIKRIRAAARYINVVRRV